MNSAHGIKCCADQCCWDGVEMKTWYLCRACPSIPCLNWEQGQQNDWCIQVVAWVLLCAFILLATNELPHDKTNKMTVRPAKTQICLGIHPVWSVFAVRMKKAWVLSYPLSARRRLWSDWADAQADLSLHWAHMPFCFVIRRLQCKNCVKDRMTQGHAMGKNKII